MSGPDLPRPLRVRVPEKEAGTYPVYVGEGLLGRLGELCRQEVGAASYAVVADADVARLYGDEATRALEEAGRGVRLFTFPPGEASKTRRHWARLTDAMLDAGLGRDACVVALGGGVTGDLAGFVAATYMRGIPVVQVSTTLLAMLDSSVGGKTGVDTPHGKNLVGAFHHPSLVVSDARVLATLPEEERVAGLAEAVKAGAIADADLFRWMEGNAAEMRAGEPAALAGVIRRAVSIKAEVVARDPEEGGLRQVLNFGHTVGHALEALAGYHLPHGHAVAAGMRVEARVGETAGITEPGTARRLAGLLAALGHHEPLEAGWGPGEVLEAMAADKKARKGRVRFVLLEEVGKVARSEDGRYTHALPDGREGKVLAAALEPGT